MDAPRRWRRRAPALLAVATAVAAVAAIALAAGTAGTAGTAGPEPATLAHPGGAPGSLVALGGFLILAGGTLLSLCRGRSLTPRRPGGPER